MPIHIYIKYKQRKSAVYVNMPFFGGAYSAPVLRLMRERAPFCVLQRQDIPADRTRVRERQSPSGYAPITALTGHAATSGESMTLAISCRMSS